MQDSRTLFGPKLSRQTDIDSIIEYIRNEIENLEYGAVNIIIHQNRIMQVETTKKTRFDP